MDFEQVKQALMGGSVPCEMKIDGALLSEFDDAKHPMWKSVSPEENYCTVNCGKGLKLTVTCRNYDNRGAELRLTLHNVGNTVSPRISEIKTLVISVPESDKNDAERYHYRRVLYAQGSNALAEDFMPREYSLVRGTLCLCMTETRSSSGIMPYFNVMQDEENGVFAAIGWSGHWMAEFTSRRNVILSYPGADFTLLPGEAVELPSSLLVPWHAESKDDHNPDSFNVFRRFMKDFVLPRPGGGPCDGAVCLRSWGGLDRAGHDACFENMKKFALPSDAYGIDAGWYDIDGAEQRDSSYGVKQKDWFTSVGDWIPDTDVLGDEYDDRLGGLASLADGGRDAGSGVFWLWVEFERAVKRSRSVKEHPEYFYISPIEDTENLIRMDSDEARHWILERLLHIFRKTKTKIFRVDYNIDAGKLFAHHDGESGNPGLTELRYYNGLYRFFEELKAELPELIIDNCASGGRRLDYRMYHYAVPLMCRSDFFCFSEEFDPTGAQAHTMALARYLPVQADSCGSCMNGASVLFDTYCVRSSMACGIGITAPKRPLTDEEGKWYHDILTEAMKVKPYMSLNFYPLTGYSLSRLDWAAWQTVSDDGGKAMVMAFRRELSLTDKMTFALHGLIPDALYEITDSRGNVLCRAYGKSLSEGYSVYLPEKRSSAICFFRKCIEK